MSEPAQPVTGKSKRSARARKHPLKSWLIYTADDVFTVLASCVHNAVKQSGIDETATPILAAIDAACVPQYDRPESPIVAVFLKNVKPEPGGGGW
jgi:hypothetical protein